MVTTALFAFDDRAVAQRAHDALRAQGLAVEDVVLHVQHPHEPSAELDDVDEVVSGGFFRNVKQLLEGVFEWDPSTDDAAAYEATLERGGAVLSVRANKREVQQQVEQVLERAGWTMRSVWAERPEV